MSLGNLVKPIATSWLECIMAKDRSKNDGAGVANHLQLIRTPKPIETENVKVPAT